MSKKRRNIFDSGTPDDVNETIENFQDTEIIPTENEIQTDSLNDSIDSEEIAAEQRPNKKLRRRLADSDKNVNLQPVSALVDSDEIQITKIDNSDANRAAASIEKEPASETGLSDSNYHVFARRSKKYKDIFSRESEALNRREMEKKDSVPETNDSVTTPANNAEPVAEKTASDDKTTPVPAPAPVPAASEDIPEPVSNAEPVTAPEPETPAAMSENSEPVSGEPDVIPETPATDTAAPETADPVLEEPDAEIPEPVPAEAADIPGTDTDSAEEESGAGTIAESVLETLSGLTPQQWETLFNLARAVYEAVHPDKSAGDGAASESIMDNLLGLGLAVMEYVNADEEERSEGLLFPAKTQELSSKGLEEVKLLKE